MLTWIFFCTYIYIFIHVLCDALFVVSCLYILNRDHFFVLLVIWSFIETMVACCSFHCLNSDVRTKAFQAVDQFLQIAKQHYEKVYSEIVFGYYSDAYHGS